MKLRFFIFLSVIYFDISALGMWECIFFFSISFSEAECRPDKYRDGHRPLPCSNPTNKINKVIILNLKKFYCDSKIYRIMPVEIA